MRIVDSILPELEQEAAITLRVLERVPEDKLSWKPHEKSMSLGQLAMHVATIPGSIADIVTTSECDTADFKGAEPASKVADILSALEKSLANAKKILDGIDDQTALSNWTLSAAGKELITMPRIGVIRGFLLNHWYHHRGQLSVYLRLLDVPVPSIYGPSADENPFA